MRANPLEPTSSGDLRADRRFAYGQAAAGEGDYTAAADLFAQTLELVPDWAPAWFALGCVEAELAQSGNGAEHRPKALRALGRYLDLEPLDRLGAGLHIARLEGADAGRSASAAYVATLFNLYAPRFDAHLVDGLGYRGPALLREAVERARPGASFARLIDLGCGTGLCAAAFADRAGSITGVDLSIGMIEQARAKNLYDRLVLGDLAGFLAQEQAGTVDLVVAADVFVYIGDLVAIFAGVARALARGGIFAFTTQASAERSDFLLGADLRYAHSAEYLRRLADACNLTFVEITAASTRRDRGADVPGFVAVLAKP